jgi:hypothetical protein
MMRCFNKANANKGAQARGLDTPASRADGDSAVSPGDHASRGAARREKPVIRTVNLTVRQIMIMFVRWLASRGCLGVWLAVRSLPPRSPRGPQVFW